MGKKQREKQSRLKTARGGWMLAQIRDVCNAQQHQLMPRASQNLPRNPDDSGALLITEAEKATTSSPCWKLKQSKSRAGNGVVLIAGVISIPEKDIQGVVVVHHSALKLRCKICKGSKRNRLGATARGRPDSIGTDPSSLQSRRVSSPVSHQPSSAEHKPREIKPDQGFLNRNAFS